MDIRVLGPLDLGAGGTPSGRRDRVVLEVLVMRWGLAVPGDQLVDALWGEVAPDSATKVLHGCVLRLRRLLGRNAIETTASGYRLAVPDQLIDARQFETLVRRARGMLGVGEPERTEYLAGQALALWRGQAYVDLEEWEPGRTEGDRLNELRLEAEELRVDACLRTGRFRDVLADAQAMVREAPMRERRWGLLALAHYQAGNQGEALRSIRRVRTVLADRLGLDPNPELDALEQAILRQDRTLVVEEAQRASYHHCPYVGLRPYDIDDSESFFGRDREVIACLQRLDAQGSVAVVGASGSGKSSLVRAGVAASLRRNGRTVVVIEPGPSPSRSLANIEVGRTSTVVVVDQCEQVFALSSDDAERTAFLSALVEHAATAPLVIALRADRLVDVAAFPDFVRLVERSLYLLTAMTEDHLQEAIEQPARAAGLKMEPGLTDLLIREVEREPGALPLLSHALQETWKRREGSMLTVDGYRATGGIQGAVANSAEAVYAGTDDSSRHLLRDMMLRLVAPGPEGEPVRSRVPRRMVVSEPAQDVLLNNLVAARLVISDDGVVEIAHEALARAWPRLRGWLDDDVEGLRVLHHLAGAADAWERLGRPDSEVYRGVRLAQVCEWRRRDHPVLTPAEAAFVEAGERLEEAEQRSAAVLAARQRRMIRRLRGALAVASVLLVVAVLASVLAARENSRTNDALERATSAQAIADAHRLGAQALLAPDASLASLLAAAAIDLNDDPVTRTNAWDVLATQPNLIWASAPVGHAVKGLSVSADGTRVAAYDESNQISVFDDSGARVGRIRTSGHIATYPHGPLAFNPRAPQLAVGSQGAAVPALQLLNSRTLRPSGPALRGLPARPADVWDVHYSPDGRYLAASFNVVRPDEPEISSVRVWDLTDRRALPAVVPLASGAGGLIALSDDGRRVYDGWPLAAYRVSDGQRLWSDLYLKTFGEIGIDPASQTLAVAPSAYGPPPPLPPANQAQLIDARDGAVAGTITLSDNRSLGMGSIGYSHDGSLIAVATGEPSLQIWTADRSHAEFTIPQLVASAFAFSPDDRTLFTGGEDGIVRAWDLDGNRAFVSELPQPVRDLAVGQPAVAPNAAALAEDFWKSFRLLVDLQSGQVHHMRHDDAGWPLGNGEPDGAAWKPGGSVYAVGGTDLRSHANEDGLVELFDTTGRKVGQVRVPAPVTGLSYSADGGRLIVSELSGRIDVLDGSSLRQIARPSSVGGPACCVAAAHAGTLAAVIVATGEAALGSSPRWNRWAVIDTADGTTVSAGSFPDTRALDIALSPDARRMAVAMADGTMRLIDPTTGRQINHTVARNGSPIHFAAFDDGGATIATSDADGALTLWDSAGGDELESLPLGHEGAPLFVDTGTRIVLGAEDATAFTWRFGQDGIHTALCRAAGRNLTSSEWATYLPGRPYAKTCPRSG
jgi:DNA-binding SARP family transcriptional activator/WD40 repeat protein